MPPFEFAAIIEFEDVDGLRQYLQHPAHETAGRYFTTAAATALALDYEMMELDNVDGAFGSRT
jgi:hypothetical protein